jgi:hypothetical protein
MNNVIKLTCTCGKTYKLSMEKRQYRCLHRLPNGKAFLQSAIYVPNWPRKGTSTKDGAGAIQEGVGGGA